MLFSGIKIAKFDEKFKELHSIKIIDSFFLNILYTQSLIYFVKTNSRKVYRFQSKVIYLILIKYVLIEKINIPILCAIPCLLYKTNSWKVYRFQSKVIHLILIKYVLIEKINIPIFLSLVYLRLLTDSYGNYNLALPDSKVPLLRWNIWSP